VDCNRNKNAVAGVGTFLSVVNKSVTTKVRKVEIELTALFMMQELLTHWLPVYKYIVLENWGKTRDISVDLATA